MPKRHKRISYLKENEFGEYDYKYAQKLTSQNMGRPSYQKPEEETIKRIEEKTVNE